MTGAPGGIPAIETRAYGCRFRSRLEARWAVFLTEAGFDWEYEPEGAALPSGNYLCDFRVTANGVSVWVEVKPPVNTEDDPRWADLVGVSGLALITVRGMHRRGDRCATAHSARIWLPDGTKADILPGTPWPTGHDEAWDRASSARFDGTDTPGRRRRGRRGRGR